LCLRFAKGDALRQSVAAIDDGLGRGITTINDGDSIGDCKQCRNREELFPVHVYHWEG
jgi:hypothetical protein